jgi:AraC-like DNA-binding protein
VLAGDGTRFLDLRSCGPIAVSTSIISRFGLRLGGSSTTAVAGTVVGSIIPSITLTGPPACAASEVSMYSIMASSCSSVSSLIKLRCSTLCSRGHSSVRIFKYAAGCVRRTRSIAFGPPCRKSRSRAAINSRLRRDLAVRYLDDRKMHVSKIAWLLGFHEVSAFTHAFKRWTGKTPSQLRTADAY